MRKNFERGRCPLCYEKEVEIHIMLVCSKTQGLRREYIEEKKLSVNPVVGLKKIMNERNKEQLRKTGLMLWRIKGLWMNEIEEYGTE